MTERKALLLRLQLHTFQRVGLRAVEGANSWFAGLNPEAREYAQGVIEEQSRQMVEAVKRAKAYRAHLEKMQKQAQRQSRGK